MNRRTCYFDRVARPRLTVSLRLLFREQPYSLGCNKSTTGLQVFAYSSSEKPMSRKFAERVRAERAAIQLVHKHISAPRLHGLSSMAVAVWDSSVDWNRVGVSRAEVLMLLGKVAHACQAIADQSRGVFDSAAFDGEYVKSALYELQCAL